MPSDATPDAHDTARRQLDDLHAELATPEANRGPGHHQAWPWVTHLEEDDRQLFATELREALDAARAGEPHADIGQLITAWENTAKIWAEDETSERLGGPINLDGPDA